MVTHKIIPSTSIVMHYGLKFPQIRGKTHLSCTLATRDVDARCIRLSTKMCWPITSLRVLTIYTSLGVHVKLLPILGCQYLFWNLWTCIVMHWNGYGGWSLIVLVCAGCIMIRPCNLLLLNWWLVPRQLIQHCQKFDYNKTKAKKLYMYLQST